MIAFCDHTIQQNQCAQYGTIDGQMGYHQMQMCGVHKFYYKVEKTYGLVHLIMITVQNDKVHKSKQARKTSTSIVLSISFNFAMRPL